MGKGAWRIGTYSLSNGSKECQLTHLKCKRRVDESCQNCCGSVPWPGCDLPTLLLALPELFPHHHDSQNCTSSSHCFHSWGRENWYMLDIALTQTHHSIPAIMLSILQTHNQPVITTGIVQTGVTFIRWQMWFLETINHHNQSNTDVYITASWDLLANTLFPSPSKTHTHACTYTHTHTHAHAHTHTHSAILRRCTHNIYDIYNDIWICHTLIS